MAEYKPLFVYLEPASIPQVVAYIQQYLEENPIISDKETIEELIREYIAEHPELIAVSSVNGKTGTVVLTGSDININASSAVSVETQLLNLASMISSAGSDITQINAQLETIYTNIGTIGTNVSNNTTAIGSLQTSVAGQGTRLSAAETDIDNLETAQTAQGTRLNTAEGNISSLQTRITQAETDIDNNESSIETLNANIGNLQTQITQNAIKTLNASIVITESGIANIFDVLDNTKSLISVQIPDLTSYMFIPLKYGSGRWFARGVNWITFEPYKPGSTSTYNATIKYFD